MDENIAAAPFVVRGVTGGVHFVCATVLAAPSSAMSATTASVAEFVSAESVAELFFQPSYLEITSSGASASARSGVPQVALRVDGTVPRTRPPPSFPKFKRRDQCLRVASAAMKTPYLLVQ